MNAEIDALVALRALLLDERTMPRRTEYISGQSFAYVKLDEVIGHLDGVRLLLASRPAAPPVGEAEPDDGSVYVRVDKMWVEKLRAPDGMEGPFKRVYLDERNGEASLFFVGAQHPTPGDADWWREVAQGLGAEIARLKQEAAGITLSLASPAPPPAAPAPVEPPPAVGFFSRCNYCGQKPCQCEDIPVDAVEANPVPEHTNKLTLSDIQRKLHINTAQAMRVQAALYGPPPVTHEMADLLRSACAIADRLGADTAWERFGDAIRALGLNGVTARTYRVLPHERPHPLGHQAGAAVPMVDADARRKAQE